MNNYVNKVVYGTSTLIDLTNDTVTSDGLYKGSTAHAADGSQITGTAEVTVQGNKLVMPLGLVSVTSGTTEIEEIQIGETTYTISPIVDFESDKVINKPLLGHLAFMNSENGLNIYMITSPS